MSSAVVAISTLVKSNIGERCVINILMNISTPALRDYLKLANIYRGNSSKKKTNLVEIIVYGHITKTNTLDKNKNRRYINKRSKQNNKGKQNNAKIIACIWQCRIKEKRYCAF